MNEQSFRLLMAVISISSRNPAKPENKVTP